MRRSAEDQLDRIATAFRLYAECRRMDDLMRRAAAEIAYYRLMGEPLGDDFEAARTWLSHGTGTTRN